MIQHVRALPTAELEPLIRLAVTQRRIEALLFLVECLGQGTTPAACQLSSELASAVLKVGRRMKNEEDEGRRIDGRLLIHS